MIGIVVKEADTPITGAKMHSRFKRLQFVHFREVSEGTKPEHLIFRLRQ